MNILKIFQKNSELFNLSKDQRLALIKIFYGNNVWVSGEPGTGKTHLISNLENIFENELGKNIQLCATTGSAAKRIGGRTVSSFLRLGIYEFTNEEIRDKNSENKDAQGLDILFIDESSMLSVEQFEQINIALQSAKGNKKPYGGVQMVLVGDDCQLEPLEGRPLLKNIPNDFIQINLEKNFRQDCPTFISLIKSMRKEVVFDRPMMAGNIKKALLSGMSQTQVNGMMIASHYEDAEDINKKIMNSLNGERFFYKSSHDLGADIPPYETQEFIVGMKVMHTINRWGLVNGDVCTIVGFNEDENEVVVQVDGSYYNIPEFISRKRKKSGFTTTLEINEKEEKVKVFDEDNEKNYLYSKYIPLIPAYAVTVRKSQGQTIKEGQIDNQILHDPNPRIRYTAISRFSHLEKISILKISKILDNTNECCYL